MRSQTERLAPLAALALPLILLSLFVPLVAPRAASADDRDALRATTARPYVFIIMDTSGSMNWAPRCTAADIAAGACTHLCTTGDCAVGRNGDDPASKFRQAKEALYEVIRGVDDIDFGFASYNQNSMRIDQKHWLYRVRAGEPQITLAGGFAWPSHLSEEVFGTVHACDTGNGDNEIGCYAAGDDAADLNVAWELKRVRWYSKLGVGGSTDVSFYVRTGGNVYYVTYDDPGTAQVYGGSIQVRITIARCTGSPANNPSNGCDAPGERTAVSGSPITVDYDLVGEFIKYENAIARNPVVGSHADGYFNQIHDASGTAGTCNGWDPNTDTASDLTGGYTFKHPTVDDPSDPDRHATLFDYGDVIPLDWERSNKDLLLNRLAPRLNGGDPASDPEAFSVSTYFKNNRDTGETFLRLKNEAHRPLVPDGSTPIGHSLKSFRGWYNGCTTTTTNCPAGNGWSSIAMEEDPKWGCRPKYIIFLTDGDDTCTGGETAAMTSALIDDDELGMFVLAFGVQGVAGNQLSAMAAAGAEVIYPQNKAQLVTALSDIFGSIREQASAFASAAVPQVQANVTDKIFLSSFTPLNDESYWAGRLDSFLKPLPTIAGSGLPDRSRLCSPTVQSECFLWDAGDVQLGQRGVGGTYNPQGLLLQAPHPDDVQPVAPWDAADLQIGTGADERRLIYSQFDAPGNRRLFTYPTDNAERFDLWEGFEIGFIVGDATSEAAAEAAANATIVTTLLEKEAIANRPLANGGTTPEPITYLLGDIFHADPVILGRPGNSNYYAIDPYLNKPLCGAAADPARFPPPSYRWFADRNFCRRSLMLAAANDGQLHAFDAGIFRDAGGADFECLLPARDLDGDGTAEANEFEDNVIDYDIGDDVDSLKSCATAADCSTGPCTGGFCRDVRSGIVDGVYDNGSGREVFSFIPREMLPVVRRMAQGADRNSEFWGMDAGVRTDDVFIDPLASEAGSVTCLAREWRTVAIGGYREGGTGYYALDLTQPDTLSSENVPEPDNGYVPSCFDGNSQCANRPYPAVLWEFQDRQLVEVSSGIFKEVELDEDLNGVRDLANSWAKATTGRIRVCTGTCDPDTETEDRFVAIFGGGVADVPAQLGGEFIYMVDIETGKVIYKKEVDGSVAADIAAIDSNGDNLIDRLYFGTTTGFLYKVQLEASASSPMRLVSQTRVTRVAGVDRTFTSERLEGPTGDETKYDPFQVFSTGGRPVYMEISAIYVAEKNRIAMAFGTGNRWDLWDRDSGTGRFYMLLDDDFSDADRDGVLDVACAGCTQPLTESSYVSVAPDAAHDPAGPPSYLFNGGGGNTLPGWFMPLDDNEKVITEAFSLSGVTFFTAFSPEEAVTEEGACSRAGVSRIFIVGTVSAFGYNIPANGDLAARSRFKTIGQFTTPPYVEQSATANPGGGTGTNHADFITTGLAAIRDELKSLQSLRCKYANYTQNIKTVQADTGIVFVAPVPLCIDPVSWKEF